MINELPRSIIRQIALGYAIIPSSGIIKQSIYLDVLNYLRFMWPSIVIHEGSSGFALIITFEDEADQCSFELRYYDIIERKVPVMYLQNGEDVFI